MSARFSIPDEIAPAIVPYMECLIASAGVPMKQNGRDLPAAVPKGTDCSAQRSLAATRADEMLRKAGGKSAEERRALIESMLAGADQFAGQALSPPAPPRDSNAPN